MRENEINEDADVMQNRERGVQGRIGTGERGMEENAEGNHPEKRGIGRGCR
jgi:hypothetical protein